MVGRELLKYSFIALTTIIVLGLIVVGKNNFNVLLSPKGDVSVKKELAYEKYSFENLAKRGGVASKIEVVGNKFYYQSEGKRISGEINYPTKTVLEASRDVYPVIIMARGYVDKEIYKTGIGTHNAAVVYAKNGYITLAPDFSGYGASDPEDLNALGARLSKPVEILDLIVSLSSIPEIDFNNIYLWGHSNGGQIMLSVAEILGRLQSEKGEVKSGSVKGMSLWAPVSKPFPYNILYYTDDASDSGKWLRNEVAQFEKDYDVFNYSIDRYLEWINIPVQLNQGSADESVPKKWSDDLVKKLEEKGKIVNYFVYPGADHNMRPGWDMVVARDLDFFTSL